MKNKLTKEQAEQMLNELSAYYGEPVKPVSKYCAALSTWMQCIVQNSKKSGHYPGKGYALYLYEIYRDIMKSNLLYRLIYCDEEFRTIECPNCNGSWTGNLECGYNCEGTGWLKLNEEEKNIKDIVE